PEASPRRKNQRTQFQNQQEKFQKMTALNNINQLLSRVKNIFVRKATPATNAATSAEPPTDISIVSDPRLKVALADIEKYLADNFGTQPSSMTYKEYSNGISLTSDDPTFSTAVVILNRANGTYNLPDNVILLGYVKTDKGDDYHIEHLGNFIIFLKRLGVKHRIQHLAIAFSKEHYDTPYDVKNADITCVRLY
ncbi:hypothetical protein, partial [Bacteroides acidifaciens]|uniref:hypothetical protein n=1 Tax=Bacteroides acidifaciens TaxID=85831 RepID=UPI0025AA238A